MFRQRGERKAVGQVRSKAADGEGEDEDVPHIVRPPAAQQQQQKQKPANGSAAKSASPAPPQPAAVKGRGGTTVPSAPAAGKPAAAGASSIAAVGLSFGEEDGEADEGPAVRHKKEKRGSSKFARAPPLPDLPADSASASAQQPAAGGGAGDGPCMHMCLLHA